MSDPVDLTIEDEVLKPVEIEIDDKGEGKIVAEAEGGSDAKPASIEDGVDALKSQIETHKREQEALRRRAEAAEAASTDASARAADSELYAYTNALEAVGKEKDTLKRSIQAAFEAGNFADATNLSDDLSKLNLKIEQLTAGKTMLEQSRSTTTTEGRVTRSDDPVEDLASRLSPKSAAWVRAHPEFVTDPVLAKRMRAAHYQAEADGIALESPEYFAAVEQRLGIGGDTGSPLSDAASTTTRRTAALAAPVSRDAPSNSGARTGPQRITLSAAEREAADNMQMSYPEYAKNKLALMREGKMGTPH